MMKAMTVKDVWNDMPKKYRDQVLIWIGVLVKEYLSKGHDVPEDLHPPFYEELTDNQKLAVTVIVNSAVDTYKYERGKYDGRKTIS